ncbi:MAG: hypothetical protein NVS9B4_22850 [Candidatus Acidiferrum sp.]
MLNWLSLPIAFLLLMDADMPRVTALRPVANPSESLRSSEKVDLFHAVDAERDEKSDTSAKTQGGAPSGGKNGALQDSSKLTLIRFVSGEFAKALKALPAGKEGFLIYVGKPVNMEMLDRQVATHGVAVSTGDQVQITGLTFKDKQIVVDVNGGGRGKKRLRDRIHIELGGMPTMRTTSQDTGPPGMQPGVGSTLFLVFDKTIPDLSPDDLKQLLTPLLDFSKQRSAAVHWADTLPPEMKKAIEARTPVLGMDREEVIAAIGKPERKVRERDADGAEIEDWIYGQPPSKTVFVRFTGEHVTSIKQFPQ